MRRVGSWPSSQATKATESRVADIDRNCVLGLRYQRDLISPGARVNAIKELIGPGFSYLELPGCRHSTLTVHRDPRALERTVSFLSECLFTSLP